MTLTGASTESRPAAGKAADVGQTTPTVFLFRGDEFRTRAKRTISFQVVKAALGGDREPRQPPPTLPPTPDPTTGD